MNILKKTKKSNRRTRRTRTIRRTSKKNIKTNNRKVKKSKKNKKNNIKPKRGGVRVDVTNDIIEYEGEVLTNGLVSCMSIFWHDPKKKKNFLGHGSCREIQLRDYHLLTQLQEKLKIQHENIKEIYIYVPEAGQLSSDENKLLDELKDTYKEIKFNIKVYYSYTPNNRGEDYLIGLSETGKLIDEYEIANLPK